MHFYVLCMFLRLSFLHHILNLISLNLLYSQSKYIYKFFFQYFELRYKGKAVRLVAATIGHLHYVSTYVHCPNELEIKYMF